jgi:hypothetical protein
MLNACFKLQKLIELRFNYNRPVKRFHIYWPRDSNLQRYIQYVFTSLHYNNNCFKSRLLFAYIYGKSRSTGLFNWVHTSERINMNFPENHNMWHFSYDAIIIIINIILFREPHCLKLTVIYWVCFTLECSIFTSSFWPTPWLFNYKWVGYFYIGVPLSNWVRYLGKDRLGSTVSIEWH